MELGEVCNQVLSFARKEYEVSPALFKDLPSLLPTQNGRDEIVIGPGKIMFHFRKISFSS